MPKNMTDAGISYKNGGSSKKGGQALFNALKAKGYKQKGGEETPAKARMTSYAEGGGLMGYAKRGGCVLSGMNKKRK
jgi:hypothetical protein